MHSSQCLNTIHLKIKPDQSCHRPTLTKHKQKTPLNLDFMFPIKKSYLAFIIKSQKTRYIIHHFHQSEQNER